VSEPDDHYRRWLDGEMRALGKGLALLAADGTCDCLCIFAHGSELGICTGEAATTRMVVHPARRKSEEVTVCEECAQAHDRVRRLAEEAP
jgi:hypothetical protein